MVLRPVSLLIWRLLLLGQTLDGCLLVLTLESIKEGKRVVNVYAWLSWLCWWCLLLLCGCRRLSGKLLLWRWGSKRLALRLLHGWGSCNICHETRMRGRLSNTHGGRATHWPNHAWGWTNTLAWRWAHTHARGWSHTWGASNHVRRWWSPSLTRRWSHNHSRGWSHCWRSSGYTWRWSHTWRRSHAHAWRSSCHSHRRRSASHIWRKSHHSLLPRRWSHSWTRWASRHLHGWWWTHQLLASINLRWRTSHELIWVYSSSLWWYQCAHWWRTSSLILHHHWLRLAWLRWLLLIHWLLGWLHWLSCS